MSDLADELNLKCEGGWCSPPLPASMIGDKGYIYCAYCGPSRRSDGRERVRKCTVAEMRTLGRGEPIAKY